MLDLVKTKKGRLAWFFGALVGGMLGNIIMSMIACQPPSPNTSPQPTVAASPLRFVTVEGSGHVRVSMDLEVGGLTLPLRFEVNAHSDPGGAGGTLDVGVEGLLDGHCKLIGGVGDCAASGLLVPKPQPVTANPPPASEGGQPNATIPSP